MYLWSIVFGHRTELSIWLPMFTTTCLQRRPPRLAAKHPGSYQLRSSFFPIILLQAAHFRSRYGNSETNGGKKAFLRSFSGVQLVFTSCLTDRISHVPQGTTPFASLRLVASGSIFTMALNFLSDKVLSPWCTAWKKFSVGARTKNDGSSWRDGGRGSLDKYEYTGLIEHLSASRLNLSNS